MRLSYPAFSRLPEKKPENTLIFAEIMWYTLIPCLITYSAIKFYFPLIIFVIPMIWLRLKPTEDSK